MCTMIFEEFYHTGCELTVGDVLTNECSHQPVIFYDLERFAHYLGKDVEIVTIAEG